MHDAKGRELKVGDIILIPAKILETYSSEDFCNCKAESLFGRRPDGLKETFHSTNTGAMLRANDGDESVGFDSLSDILEDIQPISSKETA